MNRIKPFRYKKDWIYQGENFVRYKICNYKKKNRYETGMIDGVSVFCFDNGDCLTFKRFFYRFEKGKTNFTKLGGDLGSVFKLKIKDGKVNLWEIKTDLHGKMVRNISNYPQNIYDKFFSFERNPKKQAEKLYKKRINSLIKSFLRRHKFKFKYSDVYQLNILKACYPALRDFDIAPFPFDSSYSRHFRHGDIKYAIKKCFGSNGKKITRLICKEIREKNTFQIFTLGLVLKGMIPVDYFYELLEKRHLTVSTFAGIDFRKNNFTSIPFVRKFLKKYNSKRILTLFLAEDINTFNFKDSIICYYNNVNDEPNLPENPQSWTQIHNALNPRVGTHGRRNDPNYLDLLNKSFEHFDLPIKEKYREIDGLELDEFKFEVPKNTQDLFDYSDKMSNCIRNYGNLVKDGNYNLLALYKNGELTYNISIIGNRLEQFLGKYNNQPFPEDKKKIVDFLKEKDLIRDHRFGVQLSGIENVIEIGPQYENAW